jgi:hypothetical protein
MSALAWIILRVEDNLLQFLLKNSLFGVIVG